MADKVIEGFESFEKKLDELSNPREARKVVRGALNMALTPVVKAARRNVPKGNRPHKTYKGRLVSPGFASRSIKKNVKVMGDSIVGRVGVLKEAFYALFFETGTQHIEKGEWLGPALEDNEREVLDRYRMGLFKWIKKVAAKK